MTSTTTDGAYKLTTVEQDGEYAGEEIGRVWILHQNVRGASRTRYIGVGSVGEAEKVVARAATQNAEQVDEWFEEQ